MLFFFRSLRSEELAPQSCSSPLCNGEEQEGIGIIESPGNKFPGYESAPITNSCSTVRRTSTSVDSMQTQGRSYVSAGLPAKQPSANLFRRAHFFNTLSVVAERIVVLEQGREITEVNTSVQIEVGKWIGSVKRVVNQGVVNLEHRRKISEINRIVPVNVP